MRCCGISLPRIVLLFIGILVLVAIFVPTGTHCGTGRMHCLHNLQQLHKLGTVYACQHKGQWPEPDAGGYWLSLTKTRPAYIEQDHLEILLCPLRDEEPVPGRCDYRGPRVPWSQLSLHDPVAADRPENHGQDPIQVLLKDGSAVEVRPGDPLWKRCDEVLEP